MIKVSLSDKDATILKEFLEGQKHPATWQKEVIKIVAAQIQVQQYLKTQDFPSESN